jgi:hypothetical protein
MIWATAAARILDRPRAPVTHDHVEVLDEDALFLRARLEDAALLAAIFPL